MRKDERTNALALPASGFLIVPEVDSSIDTRIVDVICNFAELGVMQHNCGDPRAGQRDGIGLAPEKPLIDGRKEVRHIGTILRTRCAVDVSELGYLQIFLLEQAARILDQNAKRFECLQLYWEFNPLAQQPMLCGVELERSELIGKVRRPGLHLVIRMRVALMCRPAGGWMAFWLHRRSSGILVGSARTIRGQAGRSCKFQTHYDCTRRNPWLVVDNEPWRKLPMPSTGVYQFGPFQLDTAERRLLRDGVQVPLRLKAFDTLRILVENAGRLVTKEALLRQNWPNTVVEENNINSNISILRRALGNDPNGQSYIETVPRVGYRFVAPVTQLSSSQSAPTTGGKSVPEPEPEKSLAVLYFENLSGQSEDEYFRDGMTEDVITELAKIKGLRLFPRSAVLALRDKPLPVTEVGRQLRAAFVVEGSVRRAGSRLRITARLLETSTGHSVWAERYDRQLEDVFAIQDEIAQNIARALRVMLSDQEKREIEKVPTRDVQAYDYYLRGRQVVYQFRRKGLEFARQMFARAIVLDQKYAAAFGGVADCSSFLYMYFEASENNLREAATASRRAVELDPESAEAHASRGLAESLSKNYPEAENEFKTAMLLHPALFDPCYFYARSCFAQGKMEEAADLFKKASELNPADYQSLSHLATVLRSLDRQAEAGKASEDALGVMERHVELYPEDARALYLGATAWLLHGERDRCLDWLGRALAIDPEETTILYNAACTYSLMGEKDQALSLLETAVHNGYGHKEWLENDPDFASLRDHPRFQALIQRLSVANVKSTL